MTNIPLHNFERAGLGKPPYVFLGAHEEVFKLPDGTIKAGGSCDYCATGIRDCFNFRSSDNKTFKVGCDCFRQAYTDKRDPLRKRVDAAEKKLRSARIKEALSARVASAKAFLAENPTAFTGQRHPFTERAARGETLRSYVEQRFCNNASSSQREAVKIVEAGIKDKTFDKQDQAVQDAKQAQADSLAAIEPMLVRARAVAGGNTFIADVLRTIEKTGRISDKQTISLKSAVEMAEEKARLTSASQHVGVAKQRLTLKVVVEHVTSKLKPNPVAPWTNISVWIVTMRDEADNCFVSFSTAFSPNVGETLLVRATVVEHGEYQGRKQTTVNRVKIEKDSP